MLYDYQFFGLAITKHSVTPLFQRVDHGGLPNPNGSLSSTVSSRAIVEANRLVEKEMNMTKVKRGPYKRYIHFDNK